jgi:pimeloyl-ACP methyl ester carboxylesterase
MLKVMSYGPAANLVTPATEVGPPIIFLHGFPALRSKQNRELADRISVLSNRKCFVLLYAGLSLADGQFSFSSCRDEVCQWFDNYLKERRAAGLLAVVDIVGHSWGGYLALLLISRYPVAVRRLVLMSPLLNFAADEISRKSFEVTVGTRDGLNLPAADDLSRDFEEVGKKDPPERLLGLVPQSLEVLFLQAANDTTTPAAIATQLIDLFKRRPRFEILNQDHSFLLDRPELSEKIADFLRH